MAKKSVCSEARVSVHTGSYMQDAGGELTNQGEGRLQPSFEPEGLVKPLSYGDSRSPKAHPMEGGDDPQSHVTARAPKDATRQVM